MSLVMGSATVPSGTTGTLIFNVPPGLVNVTYYNLSSVSTWIGTSTAVTSSNGMLCHSLPTNFFTYVGSKGTGLYATTGSTAAASATTVQYIISTGG